MKLGVILVLFILLVIVSRLSSAVEDGSLEDNNLTAQGKTKGFNVYNITVEDTRFALILVSTVISSGFASPPPRAHTIGPDEDYHFEVALNSTGASGAAGVIYEVVNPVYQRAIGRLSVSMGVKLGTPSTTYNYTRYEFFPINFNTGGTYITVRND
ncbi:hypothetical protein CGZ75_04310 [Paenibacillus herberti]|uniref:Uncharacterized protein n=2 Tax=Paenibacillus herberti TaxID=1619309 RepID=A0A229P1C7_9BACL|nr:hypothetical protein CGZ75_04310 [Paenibacillus herberti]